MNLFSKPTYSADTIHKHDIPEGTWTKCPVSGEIVYSKTLEENWMVVPKSGYHFPLNAHQRIQLIIDEGTFEEKDATLTSVDPLTFKALDTYVNKLQQNQAKTHLRDAVISGIGKIQGQPVSFAVMDFRFLGASMGSVVGEKITRCIERGMELNYPVVIVSASGGARMYEGILSLMQMAKTSAAVKRHSDAGLLYIAVLTDPTTGGVTASFAMEADIILAEPGATVGFAGARVIEQTTKKALPKGFQKSEFVLEHGFIDSIIPRFNQKKYLTELLKMHCGRAMV